MLLCYLLSVLIASLCFSPFLPPVIPLCVLWHAGIYQHIVVSAAEGFQEQPVPVAAGTPQIPNYFCTHRGSRHQHEVFYQKTQGGSALLWCQSSFRSHCLGVACLSPTMQEVKKEYSWIHTYKIFAAKP